MENNIEIKSERIQHIVGKMPSKLIQNGLYIIISVIIFTFAIAYYIKFPYYHIVEGRLINKNSVEIYTPNKSIIQDIKVGYSVQVLNNNGEIIFYTSINKISKDTYIKNGIYLCHIFLDDSINQITQGTYVYMYSNSTNINLKIKTAEESLLKHYFFNKHQKK